MAYDQYNSLASLAAAHGFRFGAAISYGDLQNDKYLRFINKHFNSITPTNELKAYSLLDQRASMSSADGLPVMNYEKGDALVKYASEHGLGVRGHVLVWDAYMLDWFFREGYKDDGAYVDRETLCKRLQAYIHAVMTHYETNFPGVIYCWDVVNEAVGDGVDDSLPGDLRRLRTSRAGKPNPFYKIIGEDYVALSFLYAKDAADSLHVNIPLFYNDYNECQPTKREAICALIESINNYARDAGGAPRKLCDGVGMQGYIGGYGTQNGCMNAGDLALIRDAIARYAGLGVQVQLTEVAVRNYRNDSITMEQHGKFYGQLMRVLIAANKNSGGALTAITIWGLLDNPALHSPQYGYMLNGPFCGLLTEQYEVKPAFTKVYEELGKEQKP